MSPAPLVVADVRSGLRLLARPERSAPVLEVLLPGQPEAPGAIEIECPEHVWGRRHGASAIDRLHHGSLGTAGTAAPTPWHADAAGLETRFALDLGLSLSLRATLEADGLRLAYTFANPTAVDFAEVQAVTCVKLRGMFADQRLERAWVHHADGFDLLASETPERVALPLTRWLPCRYLVPFRWPVSAERTGREDGILRYHKSRAVDQPFIATRSHDGRWIVATCTRETGNVWTNPERSCQHADPSAPLGQGATARVELKILVVQAGLEEALALVRSERGNA